MNDIPENKLEAISEFPYIWDASPEGRCVVYLIKNLETRTLIPLGDSQWEILHDSIKSQPSLFERHKNEYDNFKKANPKSGWKTFYDEIFFNCQDHHIRVGTPRICTTDKNKWNLNYIDLSLCVDGEIPAFQEFLDRCDHPEYLMCFVGSLYFPDNRNWSAALWLKGLAGRDGKSVIAKTIAQIFYGTNSEEEIQKIGLISQESFSEGAKRFFGASMEGKPLLVYPDNQHNLNIIQSGFFHGALGGDPALIEGKGMQARTVDGYKKVLVCSNFSPLINTEAGNEVRRVLLVNVKPNTTNDRTLDWADRLWGERYHFIYKCIETYKKLINPKNGEFITEINQEAYDSMRTYEQELIEVFMKGFVFGSDKYVPTSEFNISLNNFCNNHKADFSQIRKRIHSNLEKAGVSISKSRWIGKVKTRIHEGIGRILPTITDSTQQK